MSDSCTFVFNILQLFHSKLSEDHNLNLQKQGFEILENAN